MALARTLQGSTNLGNTTEGGSHDGTLDCGTVTSGGILVVSACGTSGLTATNPAWTAPTKSSGTATIGTVTQVISDTPGVDYDSFSTSWVIPVTGSGTLVLSVGDTGNTFGAGWTCIQYTGQDSTTPITGAVAAASNATSIANLTLGATPAAGDEVVQVVGWDTDAASGKGQTAGTNFTQRYSLGGTGDYVQMHVATRAGSVSTSTTVVPATQDGSPSVYTGTAHAFIVKAAPDSGITGTGAITLAASPVAGSGTVTPPAITGTGAITLAASTVAGSGTVGGVDRTGTGAITLAAATVAGTGTVTPPAITGTGALTLDAATVAGSGAAISPGSWPTAVSADGRYLEDQNGDPWVGLGDTAWSAIVMLTTSEMDDYLDAMQGAGVTLVLVNLFDIAYGGPNSGAGDSPWTGTAWQSSIDTDYLAHAEAFIAKANDRGITVLLCTNYFGFSSSDGVQAQLAAASNAQVEAVGAQIGAALKDYPGLMYLAGGDSDPDATLTARQNAIVAGVKSAGDDHLWSAHTGPPAGGSAGTTAATSSDLWDGESWLDFEFVYAQGTNIVPNVEGLFASMPGSVTTRPVLFGEGGYYDDDFGSTDRKDQRRDMHGGLLAGALVGFLYGEAPRWHFNGYTAGTGTWQDSLLRDATADLARAAGLYAGLQVDTLRPDTGGTYVTSGKSSGATEAAALFDTTHALVYVQTTGSITLDLTEHSAAGGAVTISRWDPTTGTTTTIGTYPTSGSQSISHPGNNSDGAADWVYLVEPSNDRTATGALTLAAATVAGTGTVTPPAVTGTGAITLAASSIAGSGTVTAPSFSGTGALTLAAATVAGTGTVTAPAVSGTGAITLAGVSVAGTGSLGNDVTGTGAIALAAVTVAGSGTVTAPTVSGSGALSLAPVTIDGSGTVVPPAVTGTGAIALAAVTVAGSGTLGNDRVGTGALALAATVVAGAGTVSGPAVTGTGALTLAASTVAGVGTVTPPGITGSGALVLARVSVFGAQTDPDLEPLLIVVREGGRLVVREAGRLVVRQ